MLSMLFMLSMLYMLFMLSMLSMLFILSILSILCIITSRMILYSWSWDITFILSIKDENNFVLTFASEREQFCTKNQCLITFVKIKKDEGTKRKCYYCCLLNLDKKIKTKKQLIL